MESKEDIEEAQSEIAESDASSFLTKKAKCKQYTLKFIAFLFSNVGLVGLVIGYCISGAFLFSYLELDEERRRKKYLEDVRRGFANDIAIQLRSTYVANYQLNDRGHVPTNHTINWVEIVVNKLIDFQNNFTTYMTNNGFDGSESREQEQWKFIGSLLYCVTVVTTIGYGNIAPKTSEGRIVTIFYAALGIPLTLLCLANLGDYMAVAFKLFYNRVVCYTCREKAEKVKKRTKTKRIRSPVKPLTKSMSLGVDPESMYPPDDLSIHSFEDVRPPDYEEHLPQTASDPSFPRGETPETPMIKTKKESNKKKKKNKWHTVIEQKETATGKYKRRTKLVDEKPKKLKRWWYRTRGRQDHETGLGGSSKTVDDVENGVSGTEDDNEVTSVFKNIQFADETDEDEDLIVEQQTETLRNDPTSQTVDTGSTSALKRDDDTEERKEVNKSVKGVECVDDAEDSQATKPLNAQVNKVVLSSNTSDSVSKRETVSLKSAVSFKKDASVQSGASSNGRRQLCSRAGIDYAGARNNADLLNDRYLQYLYATGDHLRSDRPKLRRQMTLPSQSSKMSKLQESTKSLEDVTSYVGVQKRPYSSQEKETDVPIFVSLLLLSTYIGGGAWLFSYLENWPLTLGAYFTFITLSTIGFGDIVPGSAFFSGDGEQYDNTKYIYITLYVVCGLALISMCFNLMQAKVVKGARELARKIGIIEES